LERARVPYVLAPNGTAPVIERRHAAKRLFDRMAGTRMLQQAARVLAVSEAEARQFQALRVAPEAVRLVAESIDLREFERPIPRGQFRRRLGISEGPLVLFLGKITPRKRVDLLVRAFSRLRNRRAQLVIAGNDMGGGARLKPSRDGCQNTTFTGLLTG